MFEPKHMIEGKIFIHQRRDELLHIVHTLYRPGCCFECFMGSQNFVGHFIELHCEPADLVRVIYIKQHNKNKIIAMLNQTQQILHLHPLNIVFSRWSYIHYVLPNLLQVFGFCFGLLFAFFTLAAVSLEQFQLSTVFIDTVQFCGAGLLLFTLFFVLPIALPYLYFQRNQTLKILSLLDLDTRRILKIEKLKLIRSKYQNNFLVKLSKTYK
ncbi:hypothetical protein [Acinetobacter sp.]|uniref:hypothetical protein n=1 Tax=Acinetobacter sp. TaxID=472 RepID=UPI00388F80F8